MLVGWVSVPGWEEKHDVGPGSLQIGGVWAQAGHSIPLQPTDQTVRPDLSSCIKFEYNNHTSKNHFLVCSLILRCQISYTMYS